MRIVKVIAVALLALSSAACAAAPEGAQCGECRAAACERQETACAGDQDCQALEACLDSCGDGECSSECVRSIPSYREGWALRQCAADMCAAECSVWR